MTRVTSLVNLTQQYYIGMIYCQWFLTYFSELPYQLRPKIDTKILELQGYAAIHVVLP